MAEREDLLEQRRPRAPVRYCACGCGGKLDPSASERTKYLENHRYRAHRARVKAEAKAAGLPDHLSLKTVRAAKGTGERSGDAQIGARRRKRASRPGLSVYFPTPADAERALAVLRGGASDDLAPAVAAVERALERRRR